MKYIRLLLLFCSLPILCYPQRTNLTVANGSGDAKIRGRQIVHIWADPNPSGLVFDRWTGDTALVQNPLEYHTKVNNLSLNINLTATYKPAPVWNPTYETINGSQIGYYFPDASVGVIFIFTARAAARPDFLPIPNSEFSQMKQSPKITPSLL